MNRSIKLAGLSAVLLLAITWFHVVLDRHLDELKHQPTFFTQAEPYFTPQEVLHAKTYRLEKLRHDLNQRVLTLIFLLAVLGLSGFRKRLLIFKKFWFRHFFYAIFFLAVWRLALLSEDFASQFLLEHRFNLSRLTFSTWLGDWFKASGITILLAGLAYVGLLKLMRKWPRGWAIPAVILFWVMGVVLVELSPVVLNPIFNDFKPLSDVGLKGRIHQLAEKSGLSLDSNQPVYVMAASAKTRKVNAYFTGLFKTKRIVLYDNLVDHYSADEINLVLGHEMGHWRHRHLMKGLMISLLGLGLFFGVLKKIFSKVSEESLFLPVAALCLFLGINLSQPINNWISRRFERQADRFALQITQDPQVAVKTHLNLAKENLSDPLPDRARVIFYATHPPVLERIAAAQAWKRNP